MSTPAKTGTWRNEPAGPKQLYWIKKNLAERKVGIALTDQAHTALADANLTKGDASDLLDQLFSRPEKAADVPQGVYRMPGEAGTVGEGTEVVVVVRPNQKYLEDPAQKGANLYSMSLVPAPGTDGEVRWELVFDPEAKARLAQYGQKIAAEDEIAGVLAKCSRKAAKAIRQYI